MCHVLVVKRQTAGTESVIVSEQQLLLHFDVKTTSSRLHTVVNILSIGHIVGACAWFKPLCLTIACIINICMSVCMPSAVSVLSLCRGWNLLWRVLLVWYSRGLHTHTDTQPFYCSSGICPGLPRWAGTRKVKPGRLKLVWIYWSKR